MNEFLVEWALTLFAMVMVLGALACLAVPILLATQAQTWFGVVAWVGLDMLVLSASMAIARILGEK